MTLPHNIVPAAAFEYYRAERLMIDELDRLVSEDRLYNSFVAIMRMQNAGDTLAEQIIARVCDVNPIIGYFDYHFVDPRTAFAAHEVVTTFEIAEDGYALTDHLSYVRKLTAQDRIVDVIRSRYPH